MEQYNVTGMSCAACSARVEKAVSKVPGVTACSVSLLTNSMGVEGTASPKRSFTPWKAPVTALRQRGKTRRQQHGLQKQRTHWPTMIHQCFESVSSVRWCFW